MSLPPLWKPRLRSDQGKPWSDLRGSYGPLPIAALGGSKPHPLPDSWRSLRCGVLGPAALLSDDASFAVFPVLRCRSRRSQTAAGEWCGARFDGRTAPTCFINLPVGHGWRIGVRRTAGGVCQSKQPKGSSVSICPCPLAGDKGRIEACRLWRRWKGCGPLTVGGGNYQIASFNFLAV